MRILSESARERGSAVVLGLDPSPGRLPSELRRLAEDEAVRTFCSGVLGAAAPEIAAVKLQSAYFERLGPEGCEIYASLIREAQELGLPVIADVKRGDIGPVAAAYADAHLGSYGADCATVNPYMGTDAVDPFVEEVRQQGRGGGVFVLVLTSNPSAAELQIGGDPPLFERVAGLVSRYGELSGEYPDVGAVVGATRPDLGRRVRELLPGALFLVPGFGAQGGGVDEVKALLDGSGGGVLVNSSRRLMYAHESSERDYRSAAREAAHRMRMELQEAGVSL